MALRIILSLILFQIVTFVSSQPITSVPDFLLVYCLYDTGNYTNNSDYKANLDHVLAEIPTGDGNGYGFYNLSYGGDGRLGDIDKVHAIGQCRGDVDQDLCRDCLKNATIRVLQVCPDQKDAGGWYEGCMLRYSNRSMAGGAAPHPTKLFVHNGQSVSDPEGIFNQDFRELLTDLKGRAAGGGDLRKYATGNKFTSGFTNIYALVQCTADLSEANCNNCLDDAFGNIPMCCNGTTGGRVIQSNCNFRFENQSFYKQEKPITLPVSPSALAPEMSSLSPPPPPPPGNGSNKSRVIFISVSSVATSMLLLTMVFFFVRVRMNAKKVKTHHSYEPAEETETPTSLQINFEILKVATDDFSDENKLGQGGFGSVYKGRLSNGSYVAVKRLAQGSCQGALEFKNEVTLVAKLQHRNLVRLLGFCLEGIERLLVYELVPNGSLDHFIFDPVKRQTLDWESRYKIIGGIARGLLYLHEDSRLRIIHRDLKASNILLDEDMSPKIADFGTAKLFMVDQTRDNTSKVVGTYGYMAPEYAIHGDYSMKSDVFSLGVLLLEIVSGQKTSSLHIGDHVEGLLSGTWNNWRKGTVSNIVDAAVRHGPGSEIMRVIHIALLCVQKSAAKRPTMNMVVLMLNSNSLSLPTPSEPGFLLHSTTVGSNSPSDLDSEENKADHKTLVQASLNEMSISKFYPR